MVRIAIVGGSGSVAREVVDALIDTGKHDILLLSRQPPPQDGLGGGLDWIQVNYEDVPQLIDLINASVQAGVKRFAPSEWATSSFEHLPVYAGKAEIRACLADLNKKRKVLEYCLFQPGLFTNYFAHPHRTAKYFRSFETHIDFQHRRALALEGGDNDRVTFTTAHDMAQVVARAVEYEEEWPVNGGIQGNELSIKELTSIGERVRGSSFAIETMKLQDLENGNVQCSWLPIVDHPGMPNPEAMAAVMTASMILAISAGALKVSDEWNRLLPDYKFTQAEVFLTNAWQGKPRSAEAITTKACVHVLEKQFCS